MVYLVKVVYKEDDGSKLSGWVCDYVEDNPNKFDEDDFSLNGVDYSIINKGKKKAVEFITYEEAKKVCNKICKMSLHNSYIEDWDIVEK